MLHVGMDMHKRFSVVTVTDSSGEEVIKGKRLENDEGEIRSFFESFEDEMGVVLEAGGNWYWMCDLLDGMGIDNILCHPLKAKAIASARIKTDKIDAGILSHLGRMDFVPEAYKPDMATRHPRELLRYRASMVKVKGPPPRTVHALMARLNVPSPYSDLFGKKGLAYLEGLKLLPVYREALDAYLRLLAAVGEGLSYAEVLVGKAREHSQGAQLLETIPGVGPVLSLTILAEVGDVTRFHSAKHLASCAGLVPAVSQSGSSTRYGHITRAGSSWLRWALVEAAIHASTRPGPLRDFYIKLKRRKGNKIARVAVARKLATYVYHMLKEGKEFSKIVAYNSGDLR
ncbi:MAG: IS110 family transposase [Actinomycetota bacterium]|nr:IS110 family transposase [Actinomycetota bacterium]